MITLIYPADRPNRPVRLRARTYEDLEAQMRANPWNKAKDPAAFRRQMRNVCKMWTGVTVPDTAMSSQAFITALANAGCFKVTGP